jgi:hypothetical protein
MPMNRERILDMRVEIQRCFNPIFEALRNLQVQVEELVERADAEGFLEGYREGQMERRDH